MPAWFLRLCVIGCLWLVTLPVTPALGQSANRATFGIVEAYYRPAEAAELGVGWERVIFAWDQYQPDGPDSFTPAVGPDVFAAAQRANRQIVGLIKGAPPWASASGTRAGVPVGLDLPLDDPGNHWAAFVRRLVQTYSAQGVRHWIILNEPDIRPGEGIVEFEGDVEDYAAMLRTAYRVIKSVDPGAQVNMAGLTYWYDRVNGRELYLRRLLNVLAADPDAPANNWYFDGISLHIYFTTTSVWNIIGESRAVLNEFNLGGKAVWLNEYNASPRRDPQAPVPGAQYNISLEQQADFIVQASALALAAGVDRMAVYRLYDDNFVAGSTEPWGLIRADGSRRPAFAAYQQVIRRFSQAGGATYHGSAPATVVLLRLPGSTLYAGWANTFTGGTFLIDSGGLSPDGVNVTDAVGGVVPAAASDLDGLPVVAVTAPAAEQIDQPWAVVGGPVRLVEAPGPPRAVWFRADDGGVTQLR